MSNASNGNADQLANTTLTGLGAMANSQIQVSTFNQSIERALAQISSGESRLAMSEATKAKLESALRSPQSQTIIQNSIADIQSQIRQSIAAGQTNLNNVETLKSVLGGIGKAAGVAGVGLTIADLNQKLESGSPADYASATLGALATGVAAGFFGAFAAAGLVGAAALGVGVAGAVVAGVLANYLVQDLLFPLFPQSWQDSIGDFLIDNPLSRAFGDFLNWWDPLGINADVNAKFDLALKTASPIVLDLDGDGIETFGANGTVLFDHDGDGTRHGSGWVKGDDGLLVRDINGNGVIDSGQELFGENTLLANGRKAVDGYDALRAFDENGDGKLDAEDAVWSELRVWRDMNGDGISQQDELFTLEDIGIKSIGTGSDGRYQNLGNNNHISGFGTFEWDESRGGGTGVTGDVYFEENRFYRQFGDAVEVPENLLALPDMQGSGAVRDLREAAAGSESLQQVLSTYAGAETALEQKALLSQLLAAWAGSADFRTFDERIGDLAPNSFREIRFGYSWEISSLHIGTSQDNGSSGNSFNPGDLNNPSQQPTEAKLRKKELLEMVKVLEVFNDQYFFDFTPPEIVERNGVEGITFRYKAGAQSRSRTRNVFQAGPVYLTEEDFSFGPNQEANIRAAYQSLLDSVYNGLLLQTRLMPYLAEVGFELGEGGLVLDVSGVRVLLQQVAEESPLNAIMDILDLQSAPALQGVLQHVGHGVLPQLITSLSPEDLTLLKDNLPDWVQIGAGGVDNLTGANGADLLFGLAGNDILRGGNGNDILDGGEGDDWLEGGKGNDTYVFRKGSGHDTVYTYDTGINRVDTILFEDVNLEDIHGLRRDSNDLVIEYAENDSVRVQSFYVSSVYRFTKVDFADGTSYTPNQLFAETAFRYGNGNDNVTLTDAAEIVYGGAGNDVLNGMGGNDLLYGEAGDDTLNGGAGNDILDGGTGNDSLVGGAGSDIYIFRRGSGHDVVDTYDTGSNRVDTLLFEGMSLEDIRGLRRSGNDLVIEYADSDSVTVRNFYVSNYYRFTKMDFADGTSYTPNQLFAAKAFRYGDGNDGVTLTDAAEIVYGGAGNDTLNGMGGNDRLYGGEGNDILNGGAGNDILDGGAGNDTLHGGAGSDTYLFRKGSGHDTVNTYDTGSNRVDTILFEDVNLEDIRGLRRAGNDLVIDYADSDSITVRNFYVSNYYRFTKMDFADGTSYTPNQLFAATAFRYDDGNDSVSLTDAAEIVYGGAGNDVLNGMGGNDRLYGEAGDDTLNGGAGNDILDGGEGNDLLAGGAGNDTYVFRKGSGHDVVDTYDTGANRVDTILFEDMSIEDIRGLRRSGNDLVIEYADSDSITVRNFYVSNYYRFSKMDFADGSSYNPIQLFAVVAFQYGDGNDAVTLTDAAEIVRGGEGNDTLNGMGGNDRLYGEAGDDTLNGGAGNDILDGGEGNDLLAGGAGNDTYVFRKGSGHDVVDTYDTGANRVDTILFEDMSIEDIRGLRRSGNDLVIEYADSDSVTVRNFYVSNYYRFTKMDFADGTSYTPNQLFAATAFRYGDGNDAVTLTDAAEIVYGGAGNDTLNGMGGNDRLYGGEGNDTLNGGAGNDILDGGEGNDLLVGGAGSDTYLFRVGSGVDRIDNYDTGASSVDTARFEDVSFSDLWFSRTGNDLQISIVGTEDRVTINSWYSSNYYQLDRIEAGDSLLLNAQVEQLVAAMASYGVPSGVGVVMPQDVRDSLEPVLTNTWQVA